MIFTKDKAVLDVVPQDHREEMRTFKTKDDVLTLLIHLGYLAYNSVAKEAFIPNKEIIAEFETAMSVSGWAEVMRILRASGNFPPDGALRTLFSCRCPLRTSLRWWWS